VLPVGAGQGHHVPGGLEQILGLHLAAAVQEGRKHGLVDHRLELGADEALGGLGDSPQVEVLADHGHALAAQVHLQDLLTLGRRGQVEEEELVETPFAQELGRQARDGVGGGEDEHRRLLLLHPGEEGGQHPAGGVAA
jgi:hypothetical protein